MNFRNFKRELKRKAKEANNNGLIIDPNDAGTWFDSGTSTIIPFNKTVCLIGAAILGLSVERYDGYKEIFANAYKISYADADSIENGFMNIKGSDKESKFYQIGYEIRNELIKEGVMEV